LKIINIATQRGNFTAQLLGERGDWVVCWPAQFNGHKSMQDFALLLSRNFRVVLCDPPAIGLNQSLPYSQDIKDLVYYAHQVLLKLKIVRCHWIGHSAGGVVGAALHIASPERIQSLTLASTPMLSEGRFKLHVAVSTILLSGLRLGRYILAARSVHVFGFADLREKILVFDHVRKALDATRPKTIRGMRPLEGGSVRQVFDKMRSLPPPMLILCGGHDRVVLPRDQRTVAEIMQAQYVELPCGHMNTLTQPKACADAFVQFVQTLKARRSARPPAAARSASSAKS
jgi:pimeloyl-ACP methyl ester carboxylesterase